MWKFGRYSGWNKRKSPFSRTPLSFEAPWPANPCEYPHKPYFARNSDPWATFSSLIVWVYLHSNFCGGLRKTCMWCNIAHNSRSRSIQGHPRSLIWSKNRQNCQFLLTPVSEMALARGDPFRFSWWYSYFQKLECSGSQKAKRLRR